MKHKARVASATSKVAIMIMVPVIIIAMSVYSLLIKEEQHAKALPPVLYFHTLYYTILSP